MAGNEQQQQTKCGDKCEEDEGEEDDEVQEQKE